MPHPLFVFNRNENIKTVLIFVKLNYELSDLRIKFSTIKATSMHKVIFYMAGIILFISAYVEKSQTTSDQKMAVLRLNVKNIKQVKGNIHIAIYNSEEMFMKKRYAEKKVTVETLDTLSVDLNLPKGKYAISIFHDVNDNEKLNSNLLGIPKEPYGFSNNPTLKILFNNLTADCSNRCLIYSSPCSSIPIS